MKLTIDLEHYTGLDYDTLAETLSNVIKDELEKEMRKIVRAEIAGKRAQLTAMIRNMNLEDLAKALAAEARPSAD